jgi:hypothetical protein
MRCPKKGTKRGHRHPGCIVYCLEIWHDNDTPLPSLFGGNCMARRADLANADAAGFGVAERVLGACGVGRCSKNADEYNGTHQFSFATTERLSWINV